MKYTITFLFVAMITACKIHSNSSTFIDHKMGDGNTENEKRDTAQINDIAFNSSLPSIFKQPKYKFGIDISHHQGKVNCTKVLSDTLPQRIKFVVCKVSEGTKYKDPLYTTYVNELRTRKIQVGGYHFYSHKANPKLQARNFARSIDLKKGDLIPVLDIEAQPPIKGIPQPELGIDNKQLIQNLTIFMKYIQRRFHTRIIIYSSLNFYQRYLSTAKFINTLWLARYSNKPPTGFTDSTSKVILWQFTDKGKVNGINGGVDMNVGR